MTFWKFIVPLITLAFILYGEDELELQSTAAGELNMSEESVAQERAPAQEASAPKNVLDPAVVKVLEAIRLNPPTGRSWEHLEQDEFAVEVEKWADEILEESGQDISNPKLKQIGHFLYQHSDPYWRYLGFTYMYRSGLEKSESEKMLVMLSEEPMMDELLIKDEASAPAESMVRHKLVTEMTERYGYKIVSDLQNNSSKEEWIESRTRLKTLFESKDTTVGRVKVDALMDSITESID